MDGLLAATVLVILGFVVFIVWAKSEAGKSTLRSSLGEPAGFHKTRRTLKKRPPSSKPSTPKRTPAAKKQNRR